MTDRTAPDVPQRPRPRSTGETAIGQVKEVLWKRRSETGKALESIDKYCLKYTDLEGTTVELFDEDQPLSSVSMIPIWQSLRKPIEFSVELRRTMSQQDTALVSKISALIGYNMQQLDKTRNF